MDVVAFNPSRDRQILEFEASLIKQVPRWPGLHGETPSQKTKKQNSQKETKTMMFINRNVNLKIKLQINKSIY